MFKRHSEISKGNVGASGAGGADAAQLARYKNQAAKARDKIVELVKERDKAQKDAEEQRSEHLKTSEERDGLLKNCKELKEALRKLQKTTDAAVAAKELAESELQIAIEAKRWAEVAQHNAEEERQQVINQQEAERVKVRTAQDQAAKSAAEKAALQKELRNTKKRLERTKMESAKQQRELDGLQKVLQCEKKARAEEAKLATVLLERSLMLGEDRESELNRWVRRLTDQTFSLHREKRRVDEAEKSRWRREQDGELSKELEQQHEDLQSLQHSLLLAMSDPLLNTPNEQPVKRRLRKIKMKMSEKSEEIAKTENRLKRLRNVSQVIEGLVNAATDGDVSHIRNVLHDHGVGIVDALNMNSQSAIQTAARMGHLECVQVLLEAGCDAEMMHTMGTPLFLAARFGHALCVKLMMEPRFRIPLFVQGMHDGRTALHAACCNGHLSCVQLLLKPSTQDVDIRDNSGSTPLHLACSVYEKSRKHVLKRCQIIELLVNHGASIHARDFAGNTPIIRASRAGSLDLVKSCVDCGAAILDRNRAGKSPADEARIHKNSHLMGFLNALQNQLPRSVVLNSRWQHIHEKKPYLTPHQQKELDRKKCKTHLDRKPESNDSQILPQIDSKYVDSNIQEHSLSKQLQSPMLEKQMNGEKTESFESASNDVMVTNNIDASQLIGVTSRPHSRF